MEPSVEELTAGEWQGRAETWWKRANLDCSDRHSSLVCVCAEKLWTRRLFGVVTSGDRSVRRASVLGRAALKNHWRLTEHHWDGQREPGFELQGGEERALLVFRLSQRETRTPGSACSVVVSEGTCLVVM